MRKGWYRRGDHFITDVGRCRALSHPTILGASSRRGIDMRNERFATSARRGSSTGGLKPQGRILLAAANVLPPAGVDFKTRFAAKPR